MKRSSSMQALALPLGLLSLLVLSFLGCGGGGSGSGGGATSEAALAGKERFDRVCATCHGKDAKGLPRLGKGLLDNAFVQSKSDAELVEFLKLGRAADHELNTTGVAMPPKGGDPSITEGDLQNLVAFLRSLQ